ncbi:uncharacterized protein DUF4296 [Flavobacteriaceae bacterium MAR_2010_72]|nr:uncharacterized protein DUF4296 [Flavobacteriaceae bacterium MAR_2010_72]TVZ58021.1 uncharacterized protein DUF4296 [Flavobacteriaceae bacterium MAR_2010_105]
MKYVICFLVCLFLACKGVDRPKKPDNLIAKEKMEAILFDVFILNSAKGINKRVLETNGILPENFIFEKYNIDSSQFANSNNYYAYDVKTYESIINSVLERIGQEKKVYEELDKEEAKERQRKADSTRKARRENDSLFKIDKNRRPQPVEIE